MERYTKKNERFKAEEGKGSKKSRTFLTERERRALFNDRFFDLKNLIPNPTKVRYIFLCLIFHSFSSV